MSEWRPEHAAQVRTAYDVLRAGHEGSPADVLYRHWYAVRPPQPGPLDRWAAPVGGAARAAHGGAGTWVLAESDVVATGIAGVVVVATATGRRALCRGEYVTTRGRAGFPPKVGDRVRAVGRHGAVVQEGWWRTWGSGWDPRLDHGPLVRVYLRPAPGASARLVHAVTAGLASHGEWLLKMTVSPEHLSRPDACVVYLAGPLRQGALETVVSAVVGLTAGEPPPLTATLADGVGWAEEPGTGESFGEARCAALASADARLGGRPVPPQEWLDAVATELRRRGVDPAAPHRAAATVEVAG